MAGSPSHKLSNALEGALAGGGDPATSPLYVFGPFLKLIVVAGVAQVTFGASVWMVVLTIAVVSAMYRLVMRWVTDGSGGSGLSEEEFGSWAAKVNAAITFIEYTLTFLVSMAAMVTFVADRLPVLNESILGIQYRTFLAIALSVLTGWLVNRGPKMAARTFGPATAGVLLLLWAMIIAAIRQQGFHLPEIDIRAFNFDYLHFTVGGYVRILAVMTGIEVFANLVAAYEGEPAERSKKAFSSLLIIMGTVSVTMVIVGPAIFRLSDPTNTDVSVFTQTMDGLLPDPLPYIGTLIGIVVLMSASAASAQGLQNLALGLKERHYIPHLFGERNAFEVADKPVWTEVAIVSLCFLLFGTHEEFYLAMYAAGVFILLSMTGWAVTKRLLRNMQAQFSFGLAALLGGTALAALLTTSATAIIFIERFLEGAWTYIVFIPILYAIFTYFRNKLGAPSAAMDHLGLLDAAQLAGFGFGQYETTDVEEQAPPDLEITWQPEPIIHSTWRDEKAAVRKAVVLLDGSPLAAQALPTAVSLCKATGAKMLLLSAVKDHTQALQEQYEETYKARQNYLIAQVKEIKEQGIDAEYTIRPGFIADATAEQIAANGIDLVITSTSGKSGVKHWGSGGVSRKLVHKIATPILLIQADDSGAASTFSWKRILVALDGSIISERTLPYARLFAKTFDAEVLLTSVPAVPEVSKYRAPDEFVETLRMRANMNMNKFLNAVATSLQAEGIRTRTIVTGSIPARTIITVAEREEADLIMMTSRGRGRLEMLVGSVARRVVEGTDKPVFMMPISETPPEPDLPPFSEMPMG
ncbi:MAG: universal stress protein [Anaerolineae bacterium]|nr:universal stress protein [Anaerolineae bacterium]